MMGQITDPQWRSLKPREGLRASLSLAWDGPRDKGDEEHQVDVVRCVRGKEQRHQRTTFTKVDRT